MLDGIQRHEITNIRHRKILESLYEQGSVTSESLAVALGVSRITNRKLQRQGNSGC